MAYNTKLLLTDAENKPIPQFYDPSTDAYYPMPDPTKIQLKGSYFRLSNEPKPTATDGAKDGDDLAIVDTGEVYIYYKGTWYLQ